MYVQGINMRDEREQYMNIDSFKTDIPVLGPLSTQDITRGICRFLTAMDYTPLKEFKLSSGRRVDVMGLNSGGRFLLVEIKSSVADFKSDKKWREYRPLEISFLVQFKFTKVEFVHWNAKKFQNSEVLKSQLLKGGHQQTP